MNTRLTDLRRAALSAGLSMTVFLLLTALFFFAIGREPMAMLLAIGKSALGDGYSISESLLRTTPILLCALATMVPARLGLISVGAEGQLCLGALVGTGIVLTFPNGSMPMLMPAVLLAGAVGGALWSLLPALLRTVARVNETISTLLLNYVAALLLTWLVYGAWRDPQSQGWPASMPFPEAARLPSLWDSRVHAGLLLALAAAVLLHLLFTRTRWGMTLDVLRSGPRAGQAAGLNLSRQILITMLVGGALAGLAGIAETGAVQGRLQAGFSNGAGLSGFLVAWLARNHALRAVGLAFVVGALLAAGDGLQMSAGIASSATLVVQGLLFVAVLGVGGWRTRQGGSHVGR